MPEVNPFKNKEQFLKELKKNQDNGRAAGAEIRNMLYEEKFIKLGSGTTCTVIKHPNNKERVVGINYTKLSPRNAKDIYYSSKILSTLFPHNFPQMHFASGENNEEKFSGTVREKITGPTHIEKTGHVLFGNEISSELKTVIENVKKSGVNEKYPFSKVKEELEILSKEPYNLVIEIDDNLGNYIESENGEYYVDIVNIGKEILRKERIKNKKLDIETLKKYFKDKGYTNNQIKVIESSLKRLQEIYKNN